MRILFVAPFIPYPPDGDGTRLIIWNIARELSKHHDLFLLALADGRESSAAISFVKQCFSEILLVRRSDTMLNKVAALLRSFISGFPAGVERFRKHKMKKTIARLADSTAFDAVHVDMYAMGQYIVASLGVWVMSVHDSRSLTVQEQLRYSTRIGVLRRWWLQREFRLMKHYESIQYSRYSSVAVVSKQDEEFLKQLNPSIQTIVVHNGVSITEQEWTSPDEPHAVLFSGDMSYFPNEDAAIFFARVVFPIIRRSIPDASFCIVGRNPTHAVTSLAWQIHGVIVTAEVPEIRSYLRRCAVVVAPVRYGSGVKNKVLEALAEGRPVVAFGSACEGLKQGFEEAVMCVSSITGMVDTVVKLLQSPQEIRRIGQRAREFVAEHHTWHQTADMYEKMYRGSEQ